VPRPKSPAKTHDATERERGEYKLRQVRQSAEHLADRRNPALTSPTGLLWLGGRRFLFLGGGGGRVAGERGPEDVGVDRMRDAVVVRFGGVARARCEGEGLEHARVDGGHAVQIEEEELVDERVEQRRGGGRGGIGAAAATPGLVGGALPWPWIIGTSAVTWRGTAQCGEHVEGRAHAPERGQRRAVQPADRLSKLLPFLSIQDGGFTPNHAGWKGC
jgi:hypothetical protein